MSEPSMLTISDISEQSIGSEFDMDREDGERSVQSPLTKDYLQLIRISEDQDRKQQRLETLTTESFIPSQHYSTKDQSQHDDGICAEPAQFLFTRYQPGGTYRQSVKILNKSQHSFRIQIDPPKSENFKLIQHKKGTFAPGNFEVFEIEFRPDEWTEYLDVINIRSDHGHFISVPVLAEPGRDILSFPTKLDVVCSDVKTESHIEACLRSFAPEPIDWKLTVIDKTSLDEFEIEPKSGTVSANGETVIRFTYRPSLDKPQNLGRISSMIVAVTADSVEESDEIYCKISGSRSTVKKRKVDSNKLKRNVDTINHGKSNTGVLEKLPIPIVHAPFSFKSLRNSENKKARLMRFINEIDQNAKYEKKKLIQRFVCVGQDPESDGKGSAKSAAAESDKNSNSLEQVAEAVYEKLQSIPLAVVQNEIQYPLSVWDDSCMEYQPRYQFQNKNVSKIARDKLRNAIRSVMWLVRSNKWVSARKTKEALDSERQKLIAECLRVGLAMPSVPFRSFTFPLIKPDLGFDTLNSLTPVTTESTPISVTVSTERPGTGHTNSGTVLDNRKKVDPEDIFGDIGATTEEPPEKILSLHPYPTHMFRGCKPLEVPSEGDYQTVNPPFDYRPLSLPDPATLHQSASTTSLSGSTGSPVKSVATAKSSAKKTSRGTGKNGGVSGKEQSKIEMTETLDIVNTLVTINSISEKIMDRINNNINSLAVDIGRPKSEEDILDDETISFVSKDDSISILYDPGNFEARDPLFNRYPQLMEGSDAHFFLIDPLPLRLTNIQQQKQQQSTKKDATISVSATAIQSTMLKYNFSAENGLASLFGAGDIPVNITSNTTAPLQSASIQQSMMLDSKSNASATPAVSALVNSNNCNGGGVKLSFYCPDNDQVNDIVETFSTLICTPAATPASAPLPKSVANSSQHLSSSQHTSHSRVTTASSSADNTSATAKLENVIRDWISDRTVRNTRIGFAVDDNIKEERENAKISLTEIWNTPIF